MAQHTRCPAHRPSRNFLIISMKPSAGSSSASTHIPSGDQHFGAPRGPQQSSASVSNTTTASALHPREDRRENPQAPRSRVRILEAVRYCCAWQNLSTICGRNGAYLPVSEVQYYSDNDVLLWMKLNLNTVTYSIFCKRVWGKEQAFSMRLVDRSTECD